MLLLLAQWKKNDAKYKLFYKKTFKAIHNTYSIGRFCEISNKIVPRYKRVWIDRTKHVYAHNNIEGLNADYSTRLNNELKEYTHIF